MKKLIFLYALPFIIVSCAGSGEEEGDQIFETDTSAIDSVFVDSIVVIPDSTRPETDVDALLALGDDKTWELPLTIDSMFILETFGESEDTYSNEPSEYNLSYKQANFLKHKWVNNQATSSASWDVTTFIKMDSLVANDKMEEYQSQIDLGMARYSTADVIGKVKVSDRSFLLLWMTDYATYEACPYGYGSCMFATLFTDSIALESTVVWEKSGGGDPPVWGETSVWSTIESDGITLYYADRYGEEDYDTGNEIIEERLDTFKIELTPVELIPIPKESQD